MGSVLSKEGLLGPQHQALAVFPEPSVSDLGPHSGLGKAQDLHLAFASRQQHTDKKQFHAAKLPITSHALGLYGAQFPHWHSGTLR